MLHLARTPFPAQRALRKPTSNLKRERGRMPRLSSSKMLTTKHQERSFSSYLKTVERFPEPQF